MNPKIVFIGMLGVYSGTAWKTEPEKVQTENIFSMCVDEKNSELNVPSREN